MNKVEVITLFKIIKECYQNFDVSQEKIDVWAMFMADTPYDKAQRNLTEHIKSSRYPPTPADIIRHDPNQRIDHEQQKLETRNKIDALKILQLQNPITPERMAEIQRAVAAGEYDEKFKDDPYLRAVERK